MLETYKGNKNQTGGAGGKFADRKMFKSAHTLINAQQQERPDLSQFAVNNNNEYIVS